VTVLLVVLPRPPAWWDTAGTVQTPDACNRGPRTPLISEGPLCGRCVDSCGNRGTTDPHPLGRSQGTRQDEPPELINAGARKATVVTTT
jgi:hypothetical protein